MKIIRIPFNIKDYVSGRYKVKTRSGNDVRILCTDKQQSILESTFGTLFLDKATDVIVALVKSDNLGGEIVTLYTVDGKKETNKESMQDLILEKTVYENGDFVFCNLYSDNVMIVKEFIDGGNKRIRCHALLKLSPGTSTPLLYYNNPQLPTYSENCIRLATKEEESRILNALKEHNRLWNCEKKCIEENYSFTTFEKVLVRDSDTDNWKAGFFSNYIDDNVFGFQCTDAVYQQCIPYKGNESLIRTNKKQQ